LIIKQLFGKKFHIIVKHIVLFAMVLLADVITGCMAPLTDVMFAQQFSVTYPFVDQFLV